MILYYRKIQLFMLLMVLLLSVACSPIDSATSEDGNKITQNGIQTSQGGVLILCEGNYNSGNSSLSYYNPITHKVENDVFRRVNDRKLGDTGQSIVVYGNTAYIAVENSGIVWGIDTKTFKVKGQLEASSSTRIINPRHVCVVDDSKAYISDLYAHYINIFNPQDFTYKGSVDVRMAANNGFCSTEQMVKYGKEVFVACWSYSNKILVINTETDAVCDSILLPAWQPKSIKLDKNGKLWVITDGGYSSVAGSFHDEYPHLFRIDAKTRAIEIDLVLRADDANVQITMNKSADMLYVLNNNIYRMAISDTTFPNTPFILAPKDADGKQHKLYGVAVNPENGELYVADAVDYSQSGVVYRYSETAELIDQFRVGILPGQIVFTDGDSDIHYGEGGTDVEVDLRNEEHRLVNKIYEYAPAPGHQFNGYSLIGDLVPDGATMEQACDSVMSRFRNCWMVSLGGQGGYLVAGFDHHVIAGESEYDLAILGNPFSYQSEPGIVWVSKDTNGDGLPNDPWYELAGSEYGTENETQNYEVTYYKPLAPKSDVHWKDNLGGEGIIPYMSAWNTHDYYWPEWVSADTTPDGQLCITYRGSRLRDIHTETDGYVLMPAFEWGYADNDGSDNKKYLPFCTSKAMNYFKISNARTADGKAANLDYIDFIKVQTGQTGFSYQLGEISTEVYGIWCIN